MKVKIFIVVLVVTLCFAESYGTVLDVKSLVPEAQRVVLAGLESPDGRIRSNAIEVALADKKSTFLPKIAEFLGDPVVPVRFAAAVALGDAGYEKAEKQLKQLLNDPDLNAKIAVAYALCKMDRMKYLSIIEKAAGANDQTVQANAAWLLGKLKSIKSLPLLYQLKNNDNSSDQVAFNAAEAIARIGDEKIYAKIWTMLISVYADDRYMGIRAMGALGGSKGADAVLTMLDDEVTEVRLAAAEQLGILGDISGELIVIEYLTDSQRQEKIAAERCNVLAALAIGQIGTEKLAEYLPKLLKNDSFQVRLAAAKSVFILATGR